MRLYKCDGCKKVFKPEDHRVLKIKISLYDSNDPSWPDGLIYHFCPDCCDKKLRALGILKHHI